MEALLVCINQDFSAIFRVQRRSFPARRIRLLRC